jgi:hypothetical protein
MKIRIFLLLAALVTATFSLLDTDARAQATSVFASGLLAPVKLIVTPAGNLLVAESGNGPNTGRVSIIDPSGNRRTLLDGLPSGFAPPNNDASGPSGLALRGRTLYIAIGVGDATLPGPVPGTEIANPNPSSPLFASVLSVRFNSAVEEITDGFTLTAANHQALKTGARLRLTNGGGDRITIALAADFRDFTYEARPGAPNNVRPSNVFGVVIRDDNLYVVDASQNTIREVDINTGDSRVLVRFPARPNPLPFGPPFIDPVPDSIRLFGRQLLVTFLTGFPFPPGSADVRRVNLANNSHSTLIGGLTSAIDVLPVTEDGQDRFFVLEFSTNMLMGAPGRLSRFDSPSGPPVVVAGGLISPTSIARNEMTGDIFITQIFTGQIVRVPAP